MKIADVSVPVLVLRAEGHGALGIARSLGRLGVRVYCVDVDPNAPAFASRYCAGGFAWDIEGAAAAESVACLETIAERIGGRPLLLPSSDETAQFVIDNAPALSWSFSFPHMTAGVVRALCDKRRMHALARQLRIPTAETLLPRSRDEVREFAERATFPVMLKSNGGNLAGRRTPKVAVARTWSELSELYTRLEDETNPNLMLQEYIPGGADSVWMFNGYFDESSECLFGITGRKLHQRPVRAGRTCLGVSVDNDVVAWTTRELAKAIGYRGILDIAYRYDARDGRHKLIDASPRIGAAFRLFVGEREMDVARAFYLHLTAQRVLADTPREGRKWVSEGSELVSSLERWRDGELSLREWAADLRGVEEAAWFAADDLVPFVRRSAAFAGLYLQRALSRVVPKGVPWRALPRAERGWSSAH